MFWRSVVLNRAVTSTFVIWSDYMLDHIWKIKLCTNFKVDSFNHCRSLKYYRETPTISELSCQRSRSLKVHFANFNDLHVIYLSALSVFSRRDRVQKRRQTVASAFAEILIRTANFCGNSPSSRPGPLFFLGGCL